MLQKSKSKKGALAKYALLIPLVCGMLLYVSCVEDNSLLETEEQSIEGQLEELRASISDKESITTEEYDKLVEIITEIEEKAGKENGVVKKLVSEYKNPTNTVTPDESGNVPFAVIDETPIFPGCESLTTNEERKECMSENIAKFVNKNFNLGLAKELHLTGVNRVFVSFKIDKNGFVTNLKSRAAHPDLGVEAEKVVSLLPKMEPGKQNGKAVGVLYSLPISFKIAD